MAQLPPEEQSTVAVVSRRGCRRRGWAHTAGFSGNSWRRVEKRPWESGTGPSVPPGGKCPPPRCQAMADPVHLPLEGSAVRAGRAARRVGEG